MPFPNADFVRFGPNTFTTWNETFFNEKAALKANNRTVERSGDGVGAFSAVGDVITQAGTGANGVNALAWYVFSTPDGKEFLREYVSDVGSGLSTSMDVSPAAGFTGGAFNVTPTATDQGSVAVAQVTGFETLDGVRHKHWGYIEQVAPFRYWFTIVRDFAAGVSTFERQRPLYGWGVDVWNNSGQVRDDAPDRMLYIHYGSSNPPFGNLLAGWKLFAYKDAAAPVTTANFLAVSPITGFQPNTGGATPWDGGGISGRSFAMVYTAATRSPIPATRTLLYAGLNEASTTPCRFMSIPIQMGGAEGVQGDSVKVANLIHPWDRTAIWTSTAVINGLLYPDTLDGLAEGVGPSFRMRGFDTTLVREVYWTATFPDSSAAQYTGPGPVTGVIVSDIIGD